MDVLVVEMRIFVFTSTLALILRELDWYKVAAAWLVPAAGDRYVNYYCGMPRDSTSNNMS